MTTPTPSGVPFATDTSAPLLAIGNTHDPATAYSGAVTVTDLFPESRLLTLDDFGHAAFAASPCIDKRVERYFLHVRLPRSRGGLPAVRPVVPQAVTTRGVGRSPGFPRSGWVRGLLALLLVGVMSGCLVAVPGTAAAQERTVDDDPGDATALDVVAVRVNNGIDDLVVDVRLVGLDTDDRGRFVLLLDVGGHHDYGYTLVGGYRGSGEAPQQRLLLRPPAGSPREVPCGGLSATWSASADRATFLVPQPCLGADAGPLSTLARTETSAGADDLVPDDQVFGAWIERGRRGARAFDVDGDGARDEVTVTRTGDRSFVLDVVGTLDGPYQLRGQAPLGASEPAVAGGLDLDRDGDAEVLVRAGERAGDPLYRVATVVEGALVWVRTGSRVAQLPATGGPGTRRTGFACDPGRYNLTTYVADRSGAGRPTLTGRRGRLVDGDLRFR